MSKVGRLSWFKMRAAANGGSASVDIFGDIGGYGVNFPMFARQLEALGLGAGDTMNIRINSDGGDVYQGFAIYQALALHPATKVVTIMGLAASMASVVAMAGDRRIMPANATLMIHNPVGSIVGESDEIIAFGEGVGKMKANIAQAYADASGGKLTVAKAIKLMDRQSWIGADEAVTLGLATEVQGAVKIAAKFDLSRFPNAPTSVGASTQGRKAMTKRKDEFDFEGDAEARAEAKTEAKAEVLAQQKEVNALCRVANKPELAAAFNEDGLTVSEVVAELDTIAQGGASEYVKPSTQGKTKARMTAAKRGTESGGERGVELNNRSAVDTGNNESNVPEIDPVKIWNRFNKGKVAA